MSGLTLQPICSQNLSSLLKQIVVHIYTYIFLYIYMSHCKNSWTSTLQDMNYSVDKPLFLLNDLF